MERFQKQIVDKNDYIQMEKSCKCCKDYNKGGSYADCIFGGMCDGSL